MTPLPYTSLNGTFFHQTPPSTSGTGDTIINVVFGILACIIGVITIWQAHRAWQIWHVHGSPFSLPTGSNSTAVDIQIDSTSTLHGANPSPPNVRNNHLTGSGGGPEDHINRSNSEHPNEDQTTNNISGGRITEASA